MNCTHWPVLWLTTLSGSDSRSSYCDLQVSSVMKCLLSHKQKIKAPTNLFCKSRSVTHPTSFKISRASSAMVIICSPFSLRLPLVQASQICTRRWCFCGGTSWRTCPGGHAMAKPASRSKQSRSEECRSNRSKPKQELGGKPWEGARQRLEPKHTATYFVCSQGTARDALEEYRSLDNTLILNKVRDLCGTKTSLRCFYCTCCRLGILWPNLGNRDAF